MTTSIESRKSWTVATVALAVLTMSYGGPLVTVVALVLDSPYFSFR